MAYAKSAPATHWTAGHRRCIRPAPGSDRVNFQMFSTGVPVTSPVDRAAYAAGQHCYFVTVTNQGCRPLTRSVQPDERTSCCR